MRPVPFYADYTDTVFYLCMRDLPLYASCTFVCGIYLCIWAVPIRALPLYAAVPFYAGFTFYAACTFLCVLYLCMRLVPLYAG